MLKFIKSKKGFTLVELLIVVVILGILASVAVPRFVATKAESQKQACRSNLASMQLIIEETLFTASILPAACDTLADGGIVPGRFPSGAIPTCPSGGTYDVEDGKVTCTVIIQYNEFEDSLTRVIVELKCVDKINPIHEAQLLT